MVLLNCSGTGGIYAKLANEAARHNCARASPTTIQRPATALIERFEKGQSNRSLTVPWATTCMNGASTGMTPATMAILANEIRKGLPTRAADPREVAPGATISGSPALRRDRVFLQSSDTRTTVSESRATRSLEATPALHFEDFGPSSERKPTR